MQSWIKMKIGVRYSKKEIYLKVLVTMFSLLTSQKQTEGLLKMSL